MAHIHEELRLQYEQDTMETDKPWERWEFRLDGDDDDSWINCTEEIKPDWSEQCEYRRK